MSSERWQRAEELFARALERDSSERAAWLIEATGEDELLRRSVESLLRSHEDADGFLDEDAAAVVSLRQDLGRDPGSSLDRDLGAGGIIGGDVIGAYRLIGRLGEGGMSTVFLAERSDGSFDRQVALKVVRRGLESEHTLRRLRLERQILAGLEHPHIARLYDGGQTEDGLPFFVLEKIDGEAIDRYCDNRTLDLNARIDCLLEVCDAVAYAHRHLVVHRDLKPSNVLVTHQGEVKLLDFGIAKMLAEDVDSEAATASWARVLTPQFASPEQVRGEAVTTATDVYSLGVLLYLLLTGRPPFIFSGRALREVEAILEHQAPPMPSTVVAGVEASEDPEIREWARKRGLSSEQLARRLAGDLDNIALRALESEPERRYGSVDQLAEDLRRYRSGQPVEARPRSLLYLAGKLIRRHRLAAAGAGALVLLLLAQLWSREVYIERLRDERHRAELALANQQQVADLTKELFRVAGEGEALSVGQAVARAADRLERVVEQQPRLGADLLDTAGTIFLNLGEVSRGSDLLARAVELRGREFGEGSLEQAETLSMLGVAYAYAGDPGAGELSTLAALDIFRDRIFREHRQTAHPDLVRPLNNLVLTLCRGEKYEAAAEPAFEAFELAERFLPKLDPRRARAASNRAEVLHAMRGLEAALEAYREAAYLSSQAFGAEHPETTTIQSNLALQLRGLGELEEAEQLLRKALAGRIKASGPLSPETAAIQRHLGRVLLDRQKHDEAEELLSGSRQILYESSEYGPTYLLTLIVSADLATALARLGRPADGDRLLRQDAEEWQEIFEGSAPWAYARGAWGECLLGLGDLAVAEPHLRAAQEGLSGRGPGHPDVLESERRLAELERIKGR